MALDLEACLGLASPTQVAAWVESVAGSVLAERASAVAAIESASPLDAGSGPAARATFPESPVAIQDSAPGAREDGATCETTAVVSRGRPSSSARELPDGVPARKVRWPPVGAVTAAAILAFATLGLSAAIRRQPTPSTDRALAAQVTAPAASSTPPATSGTAPLDAVPPDPVQVPVAASPSPASHERDAAPKAHVHAPRSPKATLDCDPPYSLDAQGHKLWKAACFQRGDR
jgi:serine/threonine-protein kinase